MDVWTSERVLALAPDAASASAGQSLASAKKWSGIGRSDRALWGLLQGSGKDPYQARVDLSEPAFKCSCPSRKFPCKHGVGLLLLFAKDASSFKMQSEPGWVSEWIDSRAARVEKKIEKAAAAAEKPVDVEAQAKRAAQREARVQEGIATCRVWLEDVLRRGLAHAQAEPTANWERMAARMVDSQAPGIAAMIRQIPELLSCGQGWEMRSLDHFGKLHLLLVAGTKLRELSPDLASDVRTALGWTQTKEEALAGQGVQDRWMVMGQVIEEEERLRVKRTWLCGLKTGQRALILDFAAGLAPLDTSLMPGTAFDGEVAFYPGRLAMRAVVKSRTESRPIESASEALLDASLDAGLRRYAGALAANPWVSRWPLVLARASLQRYREQWFLVDATNAGLPLKESIASSMQMWRLLSATGGGQATVLAEWDGASAQPLGALVQGSYLDLSARLVA